MDAPFVVKMDLASPLASRLTETDVTSQQAQFDLHYRNATPLPQSQLEK
jgi:hypothetical protein